MNKRIFTLCLALMAVTINALAGDVLINQENFPDEKFREFLLSQDYGKDGKISERNIESIVEIKVQMKGIKSLKGIEFFKYLEALYCDINDLGSLDVSQNKALKTLSCFSCNLQGLDVSKNTALTSLSCQNNQDLGALDVCNNKELAFLWCENDGLTSLSVDTNTKLVYLNCSRNQLSSLSLLTNKDLHTLYCRNNALTELNLTYNNKLTYLNCAGNNINAARMQDIVEALPTYTSGDHSFYVYDDEAETNNVITTKQTSITDSKRWWVYKTSDFSYSGVDGIAIHKTNFPDKKFHQFLLAQDYGKDCLLSSKELNIITELNMSGVGIKDLTGIEYFTKLQTLHCENNQLQTLDVSKNTKLTSLVCYNNQIKGQQMSALVASLPSSSEIKTIYVISNDETEQNDITTTQVAAAKEKNWIPYNYNNGSPVAYDGRDPYVAINEKNFPDENFRTYLLSETYGADGKLTEEEVQSITMLSISGKGIKNLKGIEYFTALQYLYCYNNSLTSIDVSKNIELVTLSCYNNQLTELDLSKNTKLGQLICYTNSLTSLDLSKNKKLWSVECYGNRIKGAGMEKLVNNLPTTSGTPTPLLKISFLGFNPQYLETAASPDNFITAAQEKVAKGKGWYVKIFQGADWFDYGDEHLKFRVPINEGIFPDENFRKIVASKTINTDEDEWLSESEMQAVEELEIANTNISSLEGIEYFCNLIMLQCANNQLTSLDLTNCKELSGLYCIDNQIKGEQMDALIASLPRGTGGSLYVIDEDSGLEHNVCTAQQVAAAEEKEWTVIFLAGYLWRSDYPGSDMGVAIGVTNFPDDNFRANISSKACDTDENGFLTFAELAAVTQIGVNGKGIKNLKGIEFFTALEGLYCKNNSELESLDLSKNTALKWLSCNYCSLNTLDLSNNTELVDLDCGGNKLTELNLTNNTKLKTLRCYKNQLTSLDVTKNKDLYYVGCHQNMIKALQMGQLVNDLPDVNHLESNPKFQFYVEFNAISETDEGNILTTTQVAAARAKGWNVNAYSGSVDDFDGFVEINETNFPDAKFRKFVADKTIDKNEDGYLSETEIKAVTTMDVKGLVIKKLNGIEYFKELQVLHCHGNALTTLDLSKNTKLTELTCDMNALSSLDLSANTMLTTLNCSYNSITSLDFTKNTALTKVDCVGNQIKGEGMDKLVNSLPEVKSGELCVNDDYRTSDNIITAAQVKVATNKGWRVMKITGTGDADYAGQGDANGDNKINQDDLDLIEQIVMGKVPEGVAKLAGDLNHDGKVDAADIVILVNILRGK